MSKERAWLYDLGLLDYDKARRVQMQVHAERAHGEAPDALLFVEHPPVITLGKRGVTGNLLVSPAELERRGIELKLTDRGGDVTYHGPGQLVGYPIFLIKGSFAGIHPFVRSLEQAIIRGLLEIGIRAETKTGYTGVWVGEKKIAAIGLAVKRWVTFHGFALNVENDLSGFELINACGIGRAATSVEEVLGRRVGVSDVKTSVGRGFEDVFNVAFEVRDAAGLLSRVREEEDALAQGVERTATQS